MNPEALVPPRVWFDASWEAPFLVISAIGLVTLWIALQRLNRSRPSDIYDPQRAWLRAGLFFIASFVISWATGVLPALLSSPVVREGQASDPLWLVATAVLFVVIFAGYGIVWRKGTVPHGRPLVLVVVLPFGILWGLSAGQVLLSVWVLIEKTGFGSLITAAGTYLIGGSLNGLWHSRFWDIRVSPDHNILETNTQKILLAHTPNLIFSLGHLVLFANPHLFVLAQIIALTISTTVMHFPPFWGPASAMVPQHRPEGRPRAEITEINEVNSV